MKALKYLILITLLFSYISVSAQSLESIPRKSEIDRAFRDEAKWRSYFTQSREHSYDVTYYDLHITPNMVDESMTGTNNISAISQESGLSEINLDFGPASSMTVDAVTMDGSDLLFDHNGEALTVYFDAPLDMDEPFTISIDYHGTPVSGMYFGDGEVATFTEPSDSRYWYPCWDHPLDKADSVSQHLTIPDDWEVVANGLLTNVTENGDGTTTHTWHSTYPISTYLIAFAAAENYIVLDYEYETLEGDTMPMPNYVFDWQEEVGEQSFEVMPEMMEDLVGFFGEYPFTGEKYGQVSTSAFGGGMEHQTITFLHPNLVDGQFWTQVWLYSHELAHQWWGDAVTLGSWADMWLNEGFASYTEALYWEELGYDIREFTVGVMLNSYLNCGYEHPIYDPPPGYLFSTIEYEKAGLVLNMIRGIVGDEDFYEILDLYYETHEYSNAFTADFQSVCEEVVPSYDWDTYFQQWIYEEGRPIFDVKWDYWQNNDETYQIQATLEQIQTEDWGIFIMPTEVGSYYGSEIEEYELVNLDINSEISYVNMTVENEPMEFVFDPYEWFTIKEKEINRVDKFSINGVNLEDETENQILESGETADIVITLKNYLMDSEGVSGTLSTDDPDVEVTNAEADFGDIQTGHIGTNENDPFAIAISEDMEEHHATFTLTVTDENGYDKSMEFQLFLGVGEILLVDDDEGAAYESYYIEALEDLWVIPHVYDVSFRGNPSLNLLSEYSTVIWYTAETSENTLTEDNQNVIASYLDNGGQLFLSGQNVNDEIGDTDFFTNYLHAQHIEDTWEGTMMIKGIDGDPIGDGAIVFIAGEDGANNQESPSVVEPTADATKSFGYMPLLDGSGIRYEGDYKVVYFSFSFEAITKTNEMSTGRTELMQRVLSYLGEDVGVDESTDIQTPAHIQLSQNYPNPFNPTTQISYELFYPGNISLKVYDTLGRLVKTLYDGYHDAGYHTVTWNGEDNNGSKIPSGIYYYRLEGNGYNETRQMILLK